VAKSPEGRDVSDGHIVAVLAIGFFLLDVDLVVVNPLLVPISKDFGSSLGVATFALTGYLLTFGAMQLVHGTVSDSVGRVRVLRAAMAGLAVADLAAALAPDIWVFIAARALAGASAAAIIPVTVAYVGDRVPPERFQRTMATLLSASAVGAASATLVVGVLTDLVNWRAPLVMPALIAAVLFGLYSRLPEPGRPAPDGRSVRERFAVVLADPWFRFFIPFTFVEGMAMVGLFNFFNAALQKQGHSVLISGAVTSAYGVAAIAGRLAVGRLGARATGAAMFGFGTAALFAGYVVAAFSQAIPAILVASACAGLALAIGQSALQAWVLQAAAPRIRGSAVALVACAVFAGAAVSTAAVSGLVGADRFGVLFALAAGVTVPVSVVGTLMRARFAREQSKS
jgi:predicted MFS family arabinose efflux permease